MTTVRAVQDRAELDAALALRVEVFCHEQGVPAELELDPQDEEALHLVALDRGTIVGTCRILLDPARRARLGRMAVRRPARGRGVGAALIAAALEEARRGGATRVVLNAQRPAEPLYARAGFVVTSPPFEEAGIEHVAMARELNPA